MRNDDGCPIFFLPDGAQLLQFVTILLVSPSSFNIRCTYPHAASDAALIHVQLLILHMGACSSLCGSSSKQ